MNLLQEFYVIYNFGAPWNEGGWLDFEVSDVVAGPHVMNLVLSSCKSLHWCIFVIYLVSKLELFVFFIILSWLCDGSVWLLLVIIISYCLWQCQASAAKPPKYRLAPGVKYTGQESEVNCAKFYNIDRFCGQNQ